MVTLFCLSLRGGLGRTSFRFFSVGRCRFGYGVTAWRMKRNIPLIALLAEGDNELFIDFRSICSIRAFLSAVKRRPVFQLLEFIFAQDELVVKGTDGKYLNECIVAFYKEQK